MLFLSFTWLTNINCKLRSMGMSNLFPWKEDSRKKREDTVWWNERWWCLTTIFSMSLIEPIARSFMTPDTYGWKREWRDDESHISDHEINAWDKRDNRKKQFQSQRSRLLSHKETRYFRGRKNTFSTILVSHVTSIFEEQDISVIHSQE
jgi:hypothetical protein